MRIALAYGEKFSVDAEYTAEESSELVEVNSGIVQRDYVSIDVHKVIVSFIGLPEIEITKLFTDEHIAILENQIYNQLDSENNFGD